MTMLRTQKPDPHHAKCYINTQSSKLSRKAFRKCKQHKQEKGKECVKTLLKLVFEGNRLGLVKTATILSQ